MSQWIKISLKLFNEIRPSVRSISTDRWTQPQGIDLGIKVYNCIARRKVPFIIRDRNHLSWYTCGPTVYDSAHIGHASSYVKFDIIQRILREYFHVNVITAINITDIDDKIIRKSLNSEIDWQDVSRLYKAEFFDDIHKLGISQPNIVLNVTDYIPEIIRFIQKLLNEGHAYVSDDRSVYFIVKKYANYGKLQRIVENSQKEGSVKEYESDFALWKSSKPSEPSWPAPWGKGRPGWHIECSTLASLIFGKEIDVHAGGMDLRFPHHENEDAQSCSFHMTSQWVNYWLHTGQLHLTDDTEKMSKSLKNTISIREMLTNYTSDQFRMTCLLSNYRNRIDYNDQIMIKSETILNKFKTFHETVKNFDNHKMLNGKLNEPFAETVRLVDQSLKDDFNTSTVIELLLDLIRQSNRVIVDADPNVNQNFNGDWSLLKAIDCYIQKQLNIFGLFAQDTRKNVDKMSVEIDSMIESIVSARSNIRNIAMQTKSDQLFILCDYIRDVCKESGIIIKDDKNGSNWTKIP